MTEGMKPRDELAKKIAAAYMGEECLEFPDCRAVQMPDDCFKLGWDMATAALEDKCRKLEEALAYYADDMNYGWEDTIDSTPAKEALNDHTSK